ncbi:MAG: hypothetical protein IIX10_02180 [Clostridia bacterium]|nr:hypothetical protein [Clostridia bacterium]
MKIIKYKMMTEVKNTYRIPIEEEVEKTIETEVPREVDGEIVMETVTETITETVVTGYEEKEEVTQIFSDVKIRCTEANFEANYAIAEKEAYGEITVEDDGEPDPEPAPADDDEYADMAAAIREGVNGI